MTFLVTELTDQGVAMVAESAVFSLESAPFTDQSQHYLTFGGIKVFPFTRLRCALGVWGAAGIETKSEKLHTAHAWITGFLESHPELDTLARCAQALRDALCSTLNRPHESLGLLMAGGPPGKAPQFLEITNRDPMGQAREWAVWNHVESGRKWDLCPRDGVLRLARGVSYGNGFLKNIEEVVSRVAEVQPAVGTLHTTLEGRRDYLAACVRFACDLERAAKVDRRTIGGEISFLTIAPGGEMLYKEPYCDMVSC